MTDPYFTAEQRAIIETMYRHGSVGEFLEDMSRYIQDLAAVPAPSPPTLVDMTREEREACRWMQADVEHRGRAVVIAPVLSGGRAALLDRWGDVFYEPYADVTPRPDLPRLEWPGDTPISPNAVAVGTVIESAADPRIDALPVGSILLDRDEEATMKRPWEWTGEGYIPIAGDGTEYGPWTVLHIPKEKA